MTTDIRAIVDRFVEEITAAIQSSAREALQSALGGDAPARKGRGRAAKAAAPAARGRGAKRAPEELEALTAKLQAHVSKNPGQRIEQISAGLGVATKELALPARKLIAAKAIRTKGQKRATAYFGR
jgi:hypothetical protein